MNELVCVELLVAAVERGAPPERCLQPAAGMFLRERQNRVECLERLLRRLCASRRGGDEETNRTFAATDPRLARVVDESARDILRGSGGRTLIGRLCEILASPYPGELAAAAARASGAYVVQTPGGNSLTPGGGVARLGPAASPSSSSTPGLMTDAAIAAAAADMTHVVDERGRACRKKDWLAHERKLLAECLFRAVAVAKREPSDSGTASPSLSAFATREDFESLARLFAETASPALATAAADVRARAAAVESGAAVGSGPSGFGSGASESGAEPGPPAARGGRFRSAGSGIGSGSLAHGTGGGYDEAPSALEARVGCVDELGDLAAGAADELPAALAILFATLEAVTPEDGVTDAGASAATLAAETFGPTLEAASAAAAAQFRRARDGDDADAAAEMAAANPLRSAALGGGFGGLMFGRPQDRSAVDDAVTEVSGARVCVLELARFARGLTLLSASEARTAEMAKKEIVAASDDGALVALRCVLATGAFRDDADASRRAYLALARETLRRGMRAALSDADLGEALAAVTPAMTADQIAREERHAADDAAREERHAGDRPNGPIAGAFDAYGNPAYGNDAYDGDANVSGNDVHASEGERLRAMREDEDSAREAPLVALCKALAEVYRQSPESAREDASPAPSTARAFIDAVCEWEHGVESLSAALEVLAALAASGDAGARDAWERLRAPPAGAAAAWDHFLGAVAGYNRRFAFGDEREDETVREHQYGRAPAGARDPGARELARAPDREMPDADAKGLAAYLDVLTRCLGGGDSGSRPKTASAISPAESRDRVAWLSQRCGAASGSFMDALMRLHANPVPSRLKAALLACVGAAAGDSAAGAAEAWARMEDAAILQTRANASSVAGYDAGYDAGRSSSPLRNHGYGYEPGWITHGSTNPDGGYGGYGAAAAARQRRLHELRASEGADRAAGGWTRDQLAVPGADLAYEFAHSEARARAYPHTHAYVQLVNGLMRACEASRTGPCAGAGRAAAAQFAFIRDGVFGELRRRRHTSQEERWWLARDALEHFRIQLRVWRDAVRSGDEAASGVFSGGEGVETSELAGAGARGGLGSDGWRAPNARSPFFETGNSPRRRALAPSLLSAGADAPGLEIMTDFMTDGPLFRGVCAVLAVGAERLAAERAAAHGEALEATAAEALALLTDALALDAATLEETRKSLAVDADERAFVTDAESSRGGVHRSAGFERERRFPYGPRGGRGGPRADSGAYENADVVETASKTRRRVVAMRAETVDRSLLRDPATCACVLGFSRYRFDARVSLRAIQILAVLSERNERLLDALPANAVDDLAEGAAGVLETAFLSSAEPARAELRGSGSRHAFGSEPEGFGSETIRGQKRSEEDAVAAGGAAVLDVILDALPRRAPNVAHALLGFDRRISTTRDVPASFEKFTCLTVLLELLEATPPGACVGDGDAAGACLPPEAAARVLFELVADERTAPAALEAVTDWPSGAPGSQQRLALLAADALAATPPADPLRRAAAAHHRAWLLRVAAAALDYCTPRRGSTGAGVETLDDLPPLAAALARAAMRSDANAEHAGFAQPPAAIEKPRLAALEALATVPAPPPPPLAAAAEALEAFFATVPAALADETRAARAALGVEALLVDRRPTAAGGCFEVTSRGDAVVSVPALGARLLEHSRELLLKLGGSAEYSRDAHKLAVQSAVRQARAFNASAEEHAAHAHFVGAWATFVGLVAVRCLPRGAPAEPLDDVDDGETDMEKLFETADPDRGSDAPDVLFALAEGVLARLAQTPEAIFCARKSSGSLGLGDGGGDAWWRALDPPLARLAATLLTCLRDGAEAHVGVSADATEEAAETFFGEESDGSSRAAAAASRALDAAVGGGAPGAGVVDAAAFAAHGFGSARASPPLDPGRCKALLRGLLGALRRGTREGAAGAFGSVAETSFGNSDGVALDVDARARAYESLLAFLQYARPRRAAGRFPRSVLRLAEGGAEGSIAEGSGGGTAGGFGGDDADGRAGRTGLSRGTRTSPEETDARASDVPIETRRARRAARAAARAQDELEAGVGALLRRDAVRLVDVLGRDIVDPAVDDATRAAALAVAEALLAAAAAAGSAAGERAGAGAGGPFASGGDGLAGALGPDAGAGAGNPGVGAAFADENRAPGGLGVARAEASLEPPFVADPATSALARALARAGVIRHCLAAAQSADLSDVILPTPAAAARLAATRAALGVLLRLAQLPGGARALCESGGMAALTACRAVDAYAHDSPGDAAAAAAAAAARARAESARARDEAGFDDDDMDFASFGGSGGRSVADGVMSSSDPAAAAATAAASPLAPPPLARARHHALLVPALRLAGTLLNASPDDATKVAAVAFCRQHAAVLHRVLADRSKHAHLCDVAELEAAAALVARLVAETSRSRFAKESFVKNGADSDASLATSLIEFVPALDALTATLLRGDSKYDHFIAAASDARSSPLARTSHGEVARRVAESAAGGWDAAVGGLAAPVAAAAAAKMEKALRSVRATLVSAQLSLAERGAAAFAAVERPGEDARAAPRPTLAAFARLARRCAEEMREELKARRVELRRLARDGGVAAAAAAAADARGAGGCASAEAAAAFAAAGAGAFAGALDGGGAHAALLGGSGSAFDARGRDPAALASLAAAAVGARERGVRALAVTAEAALEIVLLGAFSGGVERDDFDATPPEALAALASVLAPAVGALAELDAAETAAEASFFGGGENLDGAELAGSLAGGSHSHPTGPTRGFSPFAPTEISNARGFAGGVCADDGRLRALVRRARDALAAFAPPREVEHPALLATGSATARVGPESARAPAAKRFGEGVRAYQ